SADLVEDRILLVGRDDADRDRQKYTEEIGQADDPQRLRQALDDQVDNRAAGRPGEYAHALSGADGEPCDLFENVDRFVDEELLQPSQVAKDEWLVEAHGFADLRADLGGDCERQVAQRVTRRQIEKREDDEADDE